MTLLLKELANLNQKIRGGGEGCCPEKLRTLEQLVTPDLAGVPGGCAGSG